MSQDEIVKVVNEWFAVWGLSLTIIVSAIISLIVSVSAPLITGFLDDRSYV